MRRERKLGPEELIVVKKRRLALEAQQDVLIRELIASIEGYGTEDEPEGHTYDLPISYVNPGQLAGGIRY